MAFRRFVLLVVRWVAALVLVGVGFVAGGGPAGASAGGGGLVERPGVLGVVGFDGEPSVVVGVDGKEREFWGPWIDGGSFAFVNPSEYFSAGQGFTLQSMSGHGDGQVDGDGNFVVGSTGEVKRFYGSLFTDLIDFSNVSSLRVEFQWLVTDFDATPDLFEGRKDHEDGLVVEYSLIRS